MEGGKSQSVSNIVRVNCASLQQQEAQFNMCSSEQDVQILLLDTATKHVEEKHVNISVLIWTLNVELKALMYENSSLGTDKKGFHDDCNIPKLFLLCLLHHSLKKYIRKNCFH